MSRFQKLWNKIGAENSSPMVEVKKAYRGRAYHNWEHVMHCLTEFDEVSALLQTPKAGEVAIFFHDIISGEGDDEKRSAEVAEDKLQEGGVSLEFIQRVKTLILTTHPFKNLDGQNSLDHRLIGDIDLTILGQNPEAYEEYKKGVRQEFEHVPEKVFRTERLKILRSFLEREEVFETQYFRKKYESQARENLRREIEYLGG